MLEQVFLSVIIPAYNEEPNLLDTLQEVAGYLNSQNYSYEVIIVEDGSKDKTYEIAEAAKSLFKNFSLIKNDKNQGKGYSVKKGVLVATGQLILFMDADNSARINEIEKLLLQVDDIDVVIASRRSPDAIIEQFQPLHRRIMGDIYILLSKLILGISVSDYNCGFKLYTRRASRIIFPRLTRNDWSFDSELIFLIKKYNLKLKEVGIRWQDKRTSKVKPFQDGIKSLFSLFSIRLQDLLGRYN